MDRNAVLEQARAYIPLDRCYALAHGRPLPDRANGAVLFVDISGFTPLTEALAKDMGARRGAEELARQLNVVYDALIAEIDRYGGSVINFAGDAITCWFDETLPAGLYSPISVPASASLRAAACALACQQAMRQFEAVPLPNQQTIALAVKAAIASGPVRRFLVGDPAIQWIDTLAGQTLQRMAAAEHLAGRGQVVCDAPTATALGQGARLVPVQAEGVMEENKSFFILERLQELVTPTAWPRSSPGELDESQVRPWLLPAVYERLRDGLGEFLTELRPAVALFVSFNGVDYQDDAAAGEKLDAYIHWVQSVVALYEGALLQLTIGDKGSYYYIAFGAPLAHEDDARRAIGVAFELSAGRPDLDFICQVRIGVSQGTMRTGAYGGKTRRTYGVLGDEVNLAARLMQQVAPAGGVLASRRVQNATAAAFAWKTLPSIQVKGKAEPVPVAALLGYQIHYERAEAVLYRGTLVGREAELARLLDLLRPIFATAPQPGKKQPAGAPQRFAGVICVYGEAGAGKSRLIYELRRRLLPNGQHPSFKWFTCPADQILRQSLHPFKYFLREYFGQLSNSNVEQNKTRFETMLNTLIADTRSLGGEELAGELARAHSFLGALVDLHWEGSLYEQLEPRLRFDNALSAFKTLLAAESARQPVILHVEDAHGLDDDSHALIKTLTRGAGDYPLAVLLTGRCRDDGRCFSISVDESVAQYALDLNELSPAGVRAVAEQTLALGLDSPTVPTLADDLAAFLVEKTNGNPFFVEQLALDLRERGLVTLDNGSWVATSQAWAELPSGVTSVLIARLDRLAAHVKATVQMAAVLGREFEVPVLFHMLRDDQVFASVKQAEAEMIWAALSEARYLYRHALLRDAAYDMQTQARLQELHALAGAAIEQVYVIDLGTYYADLAYHYGRAGDLAREFHYARLAGEKAAQAYANQNARLHLQRALEIAPQLAPGDEMLAQVHFELGQVQAISGDYDAALKHLQAACDLLENLPEQIATLRRARVCYHIGRIYEQQGGRGNLATALAWQAQGLALLPPSPTAEAALLHALGGVVRFRQGDFEQSYQESKQSLALAVAAVAKSELGFAHRMLSISLRAQGRMDAAMEHCQHSIKVCQDTSDLIGLAQDYSNRGVFALEMNDWPLAQESYLHAVEILERVGGYYQLAMSCCNLGDLYRHMGDLEQGIVYAQRGLDLFTRLESHLGMCFAHTVLATLFWRQAALKNAHSHLSEARRLTTTHGIEEFKPTVGRWLAQVYLTTGDVARAETELQALLVLDTDVLDVEAEPIQCLRGQILAAQGQPNEAIEVLRASLERLEHKGLRYETGCALLALAGVLAKGHITNVSYTGYEELTHAEDIAVQARAYAVRARAIFADLGAKLDLREAEAIME